MSEILFSARGLSKRYAVTVLDAARIDVRAGEIHALIGANGAGKSTMCRIVAGLTQPTSGEMTLDGSAYAPRNKRTAEDSGVQIVQQELNLIPTLTVAENIMLGRFHTRFGLVNRRELARRARTALDRVGLQDIDPDMHAGALGVGLQQLVEIASALDRDCRLLILDEPTAALTAGEIETLFSQLADLRRSGVGMIYISHRLDEVKQLCDCVTILTDGEYVGSYPIDNISTAEMVDQMTTAEAQRELEFRSHWTDTKALRVENLSAASSVQAISFDVHRGERLGIAGLIGAGRTELLRLIFGADTADSGCLRIGENDAPRVFRHPAEAVGAGLAMVTEDRKVSGLLLPLSICDNTTLPCLTRFSRVGWILEQDQRARAAAICEDTHIRSTGIDQPVRTLSGGNQQKVAIAKWLVRDADVFLFDEPTRGIDVAARRQIYRLLDSLAQDGKAIVVVSSDADELLENCDRILVMREGRMVQTFRRTDWSKDQIMQAAFGNPEAVR